MASDTEEEDVPVVVLEDPDDELLRVLREAQRLLFVHPIAAQAAFSAFVAEGRAFAKTPDGARWKARLEGSALMRRVATLWDTASLNLLEERPAGLLPSRLLDVVVMAAGRTPLDALLARLVDHGDGNPADTT
ncbi:MAG TPA: hypothetical protein VGL81_10770 [Polyangiaceae bacterium]|jgi:hypothetical protein